MILSLASLTFSLFPHTLMWGSAGGKRQTHQSTCSMCDWVTEWLSESALIKGRDRIWEWEHKLNPFNQTWHCSLDLSTNYGASENSSATVIAALISAESHLSRQATTHRGGRGGGGSVELHSVNPSVSRAHGNTSSCRQLLCHHYLFTHMLMGNQVKVCNLQHSP